MRLLSPSVLISLVTSLAAVQAMDLMLKAPDGNGFFMVSAAADDNIRTLKTLISKVAEIPVSGMFVMKEKEWLKETKTLAEAGLKHMNEIWVLQVEGVEEHLTSDRDRIIVKERIPGMEDPVLVERWRTANIKPRKPAKPQKTKTITRSELEKKGSDGKTSETKKKEKKSEKKKSKTKNEKENRENEGSTSEETKKSEAKKEEKKSNNPGETNEKKKEEKDEL